MTERDRWLIIEGFIAGYAAADADGDQRYDRRISDKARDWLKECVDGVTVETLMDRELSDLEKIELSRIVLAAAQRECGSARVALSEGNAAGARVAMQHRWQLFGLHKFARDLYEGDMIEGSYYGRIVEALDHAFDLDIRDMGALAEERRCD